MPTETSCGVAAPRGIRPSYAGAVGALALLCLLAGCSPGPRVESAKPPTTGQCLEDAVDSLTVALFARAQRDPADAAGPRILVIDPLIDRGTGNQAAVTRAMERRIVSRVNQSLPNVHPTAFTAQAVEQRPLLLTGSI